jgi:hypothetical protein
MCSHAYPHSLSSFMREGSKERVEGRGGSISRPVVQRDVCSARLVAFECKAPDKWIGPCQAVGGVRAEVDNPIMMAITNGPSRGM